MAKMRFFTELHCKRFRSVKKTFFEMLTILNCFFRNLYTCSLYFTKKKGMKYLYYAFYNKDVCQNTKKMKKKIEKNADGSKIFLNF